MDIALAILFVGALVFLAHLFTGLFSRTKIPDDLLLMFIGLALGPAMGLVQPSDFGSLGSIFATITLIVILFQGGLEPAPGGALECDAGRRDAHHGQFPRHHGRRWGGHAVVDGHRVD